MKAAIDVSLCGGALVHLYLWETTKGWSVVVEDLQSSPWTALLGIVVTLGFGITPFGPLIALRFAMQKVPALLFVWLAVLAGAAVNAWWYFAGGRRSDLYFYAEPFAVLAVSFVGFGVVLLVNWLDKPIYLPRPTADESSSVRQEEL